MSGIWIIVGVLAIAFVLYAIESERPLSVLRRAMIALSGIAMMATSMLLV